jgi:hypothetical protein
MVDWNRKFRSEYDAARDALGDAGSFAEAFQPLAARLAVLMGFDGFDVAREQALTQLRLGLSDGDDGEDALLLCAAGVDSRSGACELAPDARRRAAALKLLRHVYLQSRAGNRRVWIVALPDEFTRWPSQQLADDGGGAGRIRQLLRSRREHFSAEQRRALGAATQHGLAWCQRAGITLALAASRARANADGRVDARERVRRWFAEDGLPEARLDALVATLQRGFKDIVTALNRGRLVITDWVPFRAATGAEESDFLRTEAFAFRARGEGLDVVYVEGAFFGDIAGNVLRGQVNWTRILVHELSHLVCGTQDVYNGQSRYAWSGIGPHAGHPHADTIRNADNWAFFAADCAGALTASQREMALRRT